MLDIITNIFNFILNDLGSFVFLPLIMLILGLLVGMRLTRSFSSAITFGVALSAMGLVIGYMVGAIAPASEAMTDSIGKVFNIVDGGWVTLASITWSWKYAFLLFPVQIGVNLLMFAFKKTKTINVDLWNVWGKIFQTIVIHAITGSIVIGLLVAVVRIIAELIVGDAFQPRLQEKTGIPGVSCPHSLFLFGAVLYPIDYLLKKIPFLNKEYNVETLKEKIGVFAENHVMGFILGILFGIVAKYSIPEALGLGIICATAMTLLPMATKLFMQALAPISEAATSFMRRKVKGDREVLIGLDGPIALGNPEIWVACMITIPFTLIWAVILPQNNILPFAGIVNLALALAAFYVCNGNIVRMIINMVFIGAPVFLLCGTALAPMISQLAVENGFIEGGTLISNSALDAPVFVYAFSNIFNFAKVNLVPILVAAYWIFGYVFMVKDLRKTNKQAATEEA